MILILSNDMFVPEFMNGQIVFGCAHYSIGHSLE